MDSFAVDNDDPDGEYTLKQQLLSANYSQELKTKHSQLLRGKLQHVLDRITSPPMRIVAHIRVYAENRPELFRDDPTCTQLLRELLKSLKTHVRRSSNAQAGDSSVPLAVFFAKTLHSVYMNDQHWPLELLELYMEDSLGSRQWVDSSETSVFTKNLIYWSTLRSPFLPARILVEDKLENVKDEHFFGRKENREGKNEINNSSTKDKKLKIIKSSITNYDNNEKENESHPIYCEIDQIPDQIQDPEKEPGNDNTCQDSDNDSSGDEEVLEDSANNMSFGNDNEDRDKEKERENENENDFKKMMKAERQEKEEEDKEENERNEINNELNINKMQCIYDRYSLKETKILAEEIIMNHLINKLGPKNVTLGSSNTWTILATMGLYCSLSSVRSLASLYLDKWLNNPALGDHLKILLCRIVECFEFDIFNTHDNFTLLDNDIDNNDNNNDDNDHNRNSSNDDYDNSSSNTNKSNDDNNDMNISLRRVSNKSLHEEFISEIKLIHADVEVVKEIVKLKTTQLKPSQLILYRNTLILISKIGPTVTKLIMKYLILNDLQSDIVVKKGMSEISKILIDLLNSYQFHLNKEKEKEKGEGKKNLQNSKEKEKNKKNLHKKKSTGQLLGEAIGELCCSMITNTSLNSVASLNSNSNLNSVDTEQFNEINNDSKNNNISPNNWTPLYSRLLIDLLMRVIKGLDGQILDFEFQALFKGVLGPLDFLVDSAIIYKNYCFINDSDKRDFNSIHNSNDDNSHNENTYNSNSNNNNNNDNNNSNSSSSRKNGILRSKIHPIEWEILNFYADVAVSLQLVLASEILRVEKESRERQASTSLSGVSTGAGVGPVGSNGNDNGNGRDTTVVYSSNSSNNNSDHHVDAIKSIGTNNTTASSGTGTGTGMGRGAGTMAGTGRSGISIRGRGGGRGSSIKLGPSSSMFRNGARALAQSGRGGTGSGTGTGVGSKLMINNTTQQNTTTATGIPIPQGLGCITDVFLVKQKYLELERKSSKDRDRLSLHVLRIQEIACHWLADFSILLKEREILKSRLSVSDKSIMSCHDNERKETQPSSTSAVTSHSKRSSSFDIAGTAETNSSSSSNNGTDSTDTFSFGLGWLQKIFGLGQFLLSKVCIYKSNF